MTEKSASWSHFCTAPNRLLKKPVMSPDISPTNRKQIKKPNTLSY